MDFTAPVLEATRRRLAARFGPPVEAWWAGALGGFATPHEVGALLELAP